jgi:hypothetical protein
MSDLFSWHVEFPTAETYAERAAECRRLAKICPEYLRESYLELAAEYEQLAKAAAQSGP